MATGFIPTTLNPSDKGPGTTLSAGDLTCAFTALTPAIVRAKTTLSTGKQYFEVTLVSSDAGSGLSGLRVGLCGASMPSNSADPYDSRIAMCVTAEGSSVFLAGSLAGALDTVPLVVGDVVGLQIDTDAHTVQVFLNGVASGDVHTSPAIAAGLYPFVGYNGSGSYGLTASANFGGSSFATPALDGTTMGIVGLIPTTWNPADKHASVTLSNGNLTETATGGAVRSTFGATTGKYYFEYKFAGSTGQMVGVASEEADISTWPGTDQYAAAWERASGSVYQNSGVVRSSTAGATTIGVLLDADAKTVQLRRNNVNIGAPIALAGDKFYAIAGYYDKVTANFGASAFTYSVPSGYIAGFGGGGSPPAKEFVASATLDGVRPAGVSPTTWSSTDKDASVTISGGGLTLSSGYGSGRSVYAIPDGALVRRYWEYTFPSLYSGMAGVADAMAGIDTWPGVDSHAIAYEGSTGVIYLSGSAVHSPAASPSTYTIGVAVDTYKNQVQFYFDDAPYGPPVSLAGLGDIYAIGGYMDSVVANFGGSPFQFAVPPAHVGGFGEYLGYEPLAAAGSATLQGATGAGAFTVGEGLPGVSFGSEVVLAGCAASGVATVLVTGAQTAGLDGATSTGAFQISDYAPAEAVSNVSLAGVAGTATAELVVGAAQSAMLAGVSQLSEFLATSSPPSAEFSADVELGGVAAVAAAQVAVAASQIEDLDGVSSVGHFLTGTAMTSSVTLDGAVGAGAATVLTHAAQARALAGVAGSGAATVSLSAAQAAQLAGITQTTKGGPVVQAQAASALEGASAEAAYLVITYARATAALEGADGSAEATVRVAGSVQTWLDGVQSAAQALVLVRAGADAALEGVTSIAALLRFGERDYFEDVSAVSVPQQVHAVTQGAQVSATSTAQRAIAATGDLQVFAN